MHCIFNSTCPAFESKKCNNLCHYFIVAHGTDGNSGLWSSRNVPTLYDGLTLTDLPDGENFEPIKKYINNIENAIKGGTGLYLYSIGNVNNPLGTGTGKTTSAIVILNEFTKLRIKQITQCKIKQKVNPALFLKVSQFQNTYNKQFRDVENSSAGEQFYRLKTLAMNVELLILDDIAIRNSTETFTGELYEIIDYRYSSRLTTIFTANVPVGKLQSIFDERITSRIEGMCYKIPFEGKDYRLKG